MAIQDSERHIERLRRATAAGRENIAKGEPWPGSAYKTARQYSSSPHPTFKTLKIIEIQKYSELP